MKKFKHFALLLLAAVVVFGCSKYDDTDLRNDVSDLQSRVEKLEKWCETANSQISALQGLVTALQENDYVTGVTPLLEEGVEIGYTISFTKSPSITINNGKNGANGKDGITPIIGVKKHTDGVYYWTIQTGTSEATFMKDAEGKMIPTTGKDGAAGQKPVISLSKDGDRYYWQVDGKWLTDADGNKVPATGDKGADGADGDSFFKSVTPDTAKGSVVIKLADDTEFTLPMLSTTVSFDAYTPLQIATSATETEVKVILPASLKKADFAAIKADITNVAGTNSAITRAPAEKWTVALTAPTFKPDGTLDAQPTVKVTVPATAAEGETALLEVTVVDTKGNKSSSTRVLFYDNRVAVTGVTLVPTTATVKVGKTETLTATVAPANASNKNVTWTTSDATVATVATDGTVTGIKAGTATITATTEDGGFTATCDVTVEDYIELNGIKVAVGDLVADGANGAKIGTSTDGGLYFQFGSLIGWSATDPLAIVVRPNNFNGKEGWSEAVTIWQGTEGTVPFTATGSDDEKAGIGDPCRYYLGGTWRLPTKDEYEKLFENNGYPSTGPWKWENSSATNTTLGLTFSASGFREDSDGNLNDVGTIGYYWSASPYWSTMGYIMAFTSSKVFASIQDSRKRAMSVRCVK